MPNFKVQKSTVQDQGSKIKDSQKGFTLVEILIVVFIIGLLSSIVLICLSGFRARGRDARRIADLHSVQNALELYFTNNGVYPNSTDWSGTGTNNLTFFLKNAGIGVNFVPNDPLYANDAAKTYHYWVSSPDRLKYVIGATLEIAGNPVLEDDVDNAGAGSTNESQVSSAVCGTNSPTEVEYCLQP